MTWAIYFNNSTEITWSFCAKNVLLVPDRDSSLLRALFSYHNCEWFVRSASHIYPKVCLIICSNSHMHVAFRLHLVPHALHLCQVNCVWTVCRQLCFDLLGNLCSCFKNLLFKYFKSQTFFIPFELLSFSPPPFADSFSLIPWILKQTKNRTESSTGTPLYPRCWRVSPVFLL